LLSHPNEKIAAEVLAFLSILLYTGNKTVQVCNICILYIKGISDYFITERVQLSDAHQRRKAFCQHATAFATSCNK